MTAVILDPALMMTVQPFYLHKRVAARVLAVFHFRFATAVVEPLYHHGFSPHCSSYISCDTDVNNREKSLRHVAMGAKFLELNKPLSCKYDRKKA